MLGELAGVPDRLIDITSILDRADLDELATRDNDLRELRGRVAALDRVDLDGLAARVDDLERLKGRVTALEKMRAPRPEVETERDGGYVSQEQVGAMGTMPPRRRPRVATSTNANEGEEVRGLADSIGAMLRCVMDRVQPPRFVKKRDVADAGAVEFKGAKGPLDAYSWVDKMEMAFESTKLPKEKKVKLAVSFLDDSAHHWWTLARRNNDGAQTMTWEQFKALFLG
ncbi:hypothetical protein ACLB2K_016066 [Fragaria x ananassa]